MHHPQRPFIVPARKSLGRSATAFAALPQPLKTTAFRLPFFLLLTMCTADAVSSHVGLLAIFHLLLMMNHLLGMVLLCKFILSCYFLFFERLSASLLNARGLSFVPSLLYFICTPWGPRPTSFSVFVRRCHTRSWLARQGFLPSPWLPVAFWQRPCAQRARYATVTLLKCERAMRHRRG